MGGKTLRMRFAKLLLAITSVALAGCSAIIGHSPDPPVLEAAAPQGQAAPTVPPEEEGPATQTLRESAAQASAGDVQKAIALLAPGLRGVYEPHDYAPIRNTPEMKIESVTVMTGQPSWPPDYSAVEPSQVAEHVVLRAEVRYRVLGIIESYFKDGDLYIHKVTVLRLKDGRWLISELSGRSG